jgi:hypothetical protein
MTSINWHGSDRRMKQRIGAYGEAVKQASFNLGQHWGAVLEAFAKSGAPWTDRTANARQSLWGRAFVIRNGDAVMIVLSHGMYYGVFLELSNASRYAVIAPTLEVHYNQIIASYRRMLGGR